MQISLKSRVIGAGDIIIGFMVVLETERVLL
jgi:hypothetical protein